LAAHTAQAKALAPFLAYGKFYLCYAVLIYCINALRARLFGG